VQEGRDMITMSARDEAPAPRYSAVPRKAPVTYLFIYRVRHRMRPPNVTDERFCTVLALGRDQGEAERIAINCVHQHGWHILRTDTATPLSDSDLGDGELDAVLRADLRAFGSSFRLHK
jgi:hypothetical protein